MVAGKYFSLGSTHARNSLGIIAGVGGETVARILAGIMRLAQPHSAIKIDFLISPNSHTFWLRQQAHALGLSLEKEEFTTEKNPPP